jgi:hypothetical protein
MVSASVQSQRVRTPRVRRTAAAAAAASAAETVLPAPKSKRCARRRCRCQRPAPAACCRPGSPRAGTPPPLPTQHRCPQHSAHSREHQLDTLLDRNHILQFATHRRGQVKYKDQVQGHVRTQATTLSNAVQRMWFRAQVASFKGLKPRTRARSSCMTATSQVKASFWVTVSVM